MTHALKHLYIHMLSKNHQVTHAVTNSDKIFVKTKNHTNKYNSLFSYSEGELEVKWVYRIDEPNDDPSLPYPRLDWDW